MKSHWTFFMTLSFNNIFDGEIDIVIVWWVYFLNSKLLIVVYNLSLLSAFTVNTLLIKQSIINTHITYHYIQNPKMCGKFIERTSLSLFISIIHRNLPERSSWNLANPSSFRTECKLRNFQAATLKTKQNTLEKPQKR